MNLKYLHIKTLFNTRKVNLYGSLLIINILKQLKWSKFYSPFIAA